MTLATIMVSLALDQSNEARLAVTGQLAEQFDAAVIGIAAAQFAPPLYFTDGDLAQGVIDEGEAAVRQRLAALGTAFGDAIRRRTAKPVEWRSALDFPARYTLREARGADLIVSGGYNPAFSDAYSFASAKDLVTQAGRPVLVVPDGVTWLDLRKVMVAWKDTAESRRALHDALPLLARAQDVILVEVPESGGREPADKRLADVAAFLARHGIVATTRVNERIAGRSAALQLDDIAADLGAGLVVAGAYGHSRFRELVLGGVTEHFLTQSVRCVLLSH